MSFIIAVDGPSASGKGTITKKLSKDLGIINLDTGALYRCVTLEVLRNNVELTDTVKIVEIATNMNVEFKKEGEEELVFLNGEDVSRDIRTNEVTKNVMPISTIKEVREKMVDIQRNLAKNMDVIMEGRDIGTCVFPNADVKIYLDADVNTRAMRRYKENIEKGIENTYEEALELIKYRDKIDTQREASPLVKADDAILVDSTDMSIDEVVEVIKNIVKEKMGEQNG